MPNIDVHAHILPQSAVRAYEEGRDWFGTTITRNADGTTGLQTGTRKATLSAMPEYWQPHRDRIRTMDEDGIDIQVMSLNPQFFRDHLDADLAIACAQSVNEEIAEAVAEDPRPLPRHRRPAAAGFSGPPCASSSGRCRC